MCAVLKMRVACVSFKLMSPWANHTYLVDSHDSRDNIGAFLKHNGRPWLRCIDQRFEILCHIQTAVPVAAAASEKSNQIRKEGRLNADLQIKASGSIRPQEH
jgi:hypothetical protein